MSPRLGRLCTPVVLLLACGLGAAGCTTENAEPSAALQPTPGAASRAPARAVADWFAAMSRGDAGAVSAGFTRSAHARIEPRELRAAVSGDLGRYARAAGLEVLYQERAGDRINVFFTIETGELSGDTLIKSSSAQMVALPLVRGKGRWLIDNSAWLESEIARLARVRKTRTERIGAPR